MIAFGTMPAKNSSSDTSTAKPKRKRARKSEPAAPVAVSQIHHSPALYAAARRVLRDRGLPVELARIRPVPGRQALDVDVTPRPALLPRR